MIEIWWQVTGIPTENQLLEDLRRHKHRPSYIEKCLHNLSRLIPNFGDAREDVIQVCIWKQLHIPIITIISEPDIRYIKLQLNFFNS
jgi:hypothetical protein